MIHTFQRLHAWYKRPNKSKLEQYIESIIIILPLAFLIRTYIYGLYQVPTGSMETTMLVGEGFFADKFSYLFRPIKHGDIVTFNDPNFDYSDNYFVNLFQNNVWGPANWTKRIIGVPGDYIQGKIENGIPVLYRNGEKLDEPYLNKFPLLSVFYGNCLLTVSYDQSYSYEDQPFYRMSSADVQLGKRWAETYKQDIMRFPRTPAFDQHGRNVDEFDIHLGPDQYWAMGDNRLGSLDSRFWGPLARKLIHGKIILRIWSVDTHASWMILDFIKHPIDFWRHVRWRRCLHWMY